MKLPDREKAYVPPRKLIDYLLSSSHPVGGPKACFFRSAGFDETNVTSLERALIDIAHSEDVTEIEQTPHGTKYVIEGDIRTAAGETKKVRTVWIIDAGQGVPRFITAYPL